jgi:hypothetical protein
MLVKWNLRFEVNVFIWFKRGSLSSICPYCLRLVDIDIPIRDGYTYCNIYIELKLWHKFTILGKRLLLFLFMSARRFGLWLLIIYIIWKQRYVENIFLHKINTKMIYCELTRMSLSLPFIFGNHIITF